MSSQANLRLLNELDYEAVSLALGVELNLDVPSHVISTVLISRMGELSADEKAALPTFVVESIQRYLRDNQSPKLGNLPQNPETHESPEIAVIETNEEMHHEPEETQFTRISADKIAYVLPPDYEGAPVSEIMENFPRLDAWAKSGQISVQMQGRKMLISGDCLGPWDDEKLLQIVESIVTP